jgi:hypothetical protein
VRREREREKKDEGKGGERAMRNLSMNNGKN